MRTPPATTPLVGLLASALNPQDEDDRWANGFTYSDVEGCSTGYITSKCDPQPGDRALPRLATPPDWEPYVVGTGVECSTFGWRAREWQAMARRALDAAAEFQISAELWTGAQSQTEGLGNRFLADVSTVDILTESGAVNLTHGLACLEQYLRDTLGGQRGMIHATAQTVTHWHGLDLIRFESGRLLTILGTIVVPGAGYDGSTPDGAAASDDDVWAYATGMVEVRRSEPDISPQEDDWHQIARSTNLVEVRAEQEAVASWNGCAHAGARLAIDVCDVGGS